MTHNGRRKFLLTDRELTALRWAANGLTGEQIAEKTGLSTSAVADTVRRARVALRASNTAHAVALAVAHGYLTRDDLKDLDDEWRGGTW